MNPAILRQQQTKVEQEYDALVTQLNRCQGQLGAKQAQALKLAPPEYQQWLVDKKAEHVTLTSKLQAKKQQRAEARRRFNSWKPEYKEEWLEWPDDEGWWWNHSHSTAPFGSVSIFKFLWDVGAQAFVMHPQHAGDAGNFDAYWKFQEAPEAPE